MDETMKAYIIKMTMITLAAMCAVFGPIYYYITQGIKSSTIEVKIPNIDDERTEFFCNLFIQFVIFIQGFFYYYGMECAMSLFENTVKVTPRLIKSRLSGLTKMYERKEVSTLQLRFAFLDMTKQLLDYERYVLIE